MTADTSPIVVLSALRDQPMHSVTCSSSLPFVAQVTVGHGPQQAEGRPTSFGAGVA